MVHGGVQNITLVKQALQWAGSRAPQRSQQGTSVLHRALGSAKNVPWPFRRSITSLPAVLKSIRNTSQGNEAIGLCVEKAVPVLSAHAALVLT